LAGTAGFRVSAGGFGAAVEGWSVTVLWEGVLVRDILDEAGVRSEANTVIFHAHDGYSTSHPLDYFYDNDIIMAYRMNNVTMPPERGYPFQLVAEDRWGYKWIKWITRIELSDDPDYRGYWERRGYNQEGDYSGPKFG
jgi:DMSO/TMAO reductase YedYZ molybdopterin-dependent catalytic subunit